MLGNNDDYSSQSMCCGLVTIYTASMLACMILNAATKGPMSCFETLGIDFAETRFDLHRSVAGSIVATMGLLGAIILVVARLSFNRVSDATLIYGGISVFIIGIGMNLYLDEERPEENSPWRYALSMFLSYSIGYPICHNALVGLFSKSKSIPTILQHIQDFFFISSILNFLCCNSCRSSTTRNSSGFFLSIRFSSSSYFPCYGRLHNDLQWHRNPIYCFTCLLDDRLVVCICM